MSRAFPRRHFRLYAPLRGICAVLFKIADFLVPKSPEIVITTFPDGDDQGVALCLALQEMGWKGRVNWLVGKKGALPEDWAARRGITSLDLRFFRRYSLVGFWRFVRAKWVFYTHGVYFSYRPPASKTVVNLWHGMPVKKIWQGVPGASEAPESTLLVSTSPFFSDVLMRASGFGRERMLESGLPRNDFLLHPRPEAVAAGARFRGAAKRLILFLPTYRKSRVGFITSDGEETGNLLGMSATDAGKFHAWLREHDCKLIVKPHPMSVHAGAAFNNDEVWEMVDERSLIKEGIGLYELLSQADLVITDISSIFVDFLTTGRPQIFYFPDKQKYQDSRGMLLHPLEDFVPGPIANDWLELESDLREWHSGPDRWQTKRSALQKLMVASETGASAKKIVESVGVFENPTLSGKGWQQTAALVWVQYGPYHLARAREFQKHSASKMRVIPVEIGSKSSTYLWDRGSDVENLQTLFPGASAESLPGVAIYQRTVDFLRTHKVGLVFVPSYWPVSSFAVILAARTVGARVIMMTDSHAHTAKARGVWARVKRALVLQFDAAFVAGEPQRDYFQSLGLSSHKIVTGYDVVDNDFFAARSSRLQNEEVRTQVRATEGLPARYFLSVGRMVWKKNFETLIDAYSLVKARLGPNCPALVFVGSGKLESPLRERCLSLGFSVHQTAGSEARVRTGHADVYFLGFRQAEALAAIYTLAECFVLPSREEEWGLVVNEAMACGTPVIVSEVAGCARDLVKHGINGFLFKPFDTASLAAHLEEIAGDAGRARQMGQESRKIIANWGCERFAQAAAEAGNIALGTPARSSN